MPGSEKALRETDPTQWALHERVKELTCLYGIAQAADKPGLGIEEIMSGVVGLLPPAWQYPDIATARILLDGRQHATPGFVAAPRAQRAHILVNGDRRGLVEVAYTEERPDQDEGPFLREERSLINEVARQVGLILERRQAREERVRLEDKLRHADRLVTIGRLAAGVAHELNEPLGAILGFAQLTRKNFGLPDQTGRDLDKIVKAALHAREIVKKLLIFARQTPAQKVPVNLNDAVKEGLYFMTTQCAKAGVRVLLDLAPDLPSVQADPSQLQQVILNLAANAVQSMAAGGTLSLRTRAGDGAVVLVVEDTGEGMTEDVQRHVFTPFFTTKDVGQGTGLGLAVVHGIVTGHGGTIGLESEAGRGTRFTIHLPHDGPHREEGA